MSIEFDGLVVLTTVTVKNTVFRDVVPCSRRISHTNNEQHGSKQHPVHIKLGFRRLSEIKTPSRQGTGIAQSVERLATGWTSEEVKVKKASIYASTPPYVFMA
jgi:hypothetical protein